MQTTIPGRSPIALVSILYPRKPSCSSATNVARIPRIPSKPRLSRDAHQTGCWESRLSSQEDEPMRLYVPMGKGKGCCHPLSTTHDLRSWRMVASG